MPDIFTFADNLNISGVLKTMKYAVKHHLILKGSRIYIAPFLLLSIIIILSICQPAFADLIEDLFVEANRSYEQEDYETAVKRYKNIINYKIENPAIYFNLGNSCFKLDRLGEAILYYEKALRLAPRDADITENLTLARMMTVDKVELPTPGLLANLVATFYNFFSINELAYLTLFHFVGVMILFCLILLIRSPLGRKFLWYLNGFGIGLLLIFAITFYIKLDNQRNIVEAIVLRPKLDAYSSPDQDVDIAFTVHEVKKVTILQDLERWVKIELENGWQGWVAQENLGRI